MKSLFLSTDIVAIDAAGAKTFGIEPNQIDHIVFAHNHGLGQIDLEKLNISRIKI